MIEEKNLSIPVFLFTTCFLSLFTLLLFFAESAYLLWVFFFLSIFYLSITGYLWSRRKLQVTHSEVKIVLSLGGFLICALALTPLSISIPLSIHRWILLAVGGLTFAFFLPKKLVPQSLFNLIILGSIIPTFILFLWNVGLLFFPSTQGSLPSSTLLTFTYGHNHAYIYYLYSLIVCLYYKDQSKEKLWWTLALSVSVMGVLISFSRVGLFFMLLVFARRVFANATHQKLISRFILGALGLYILTITAFSAMPSLSFGQNCIVPIFKSQVCKSLISEGRVEYWKQTFKGILDHPVIGNGGGTFGVASSMYRKSPEYYTSMPHNEYLQLVYEYGVVGIVAVAFYVWALYWIFTQRKKAKGITPSLIAVIFIFSIDALFNYNWNISVVFILHCLVLAYVIRSLLDTPNKIKASQKKNIFYALSLVLIATGVVFYSSRYIAAELLFHNKPTTYIKVFPYLKWYVKEALRDQSLDEKDKDRLLTLYKTDREVYRIYVDQLSENSEERRKGLEYLISLDQFDQQSRVDLIYYGMRTQNPELIKRELTWLLNYYPAGHRSWILNLSARYMEQIIAYANDLADRDAKLANEITVLTYNFEPWKINGSHTIFLLDPERFEDAYVENILRVPNAPSLHAYYESLPPWLITKSVEAAKKDDWERSRFFSIVALKTADWQRWQLWEDITAVFTQKLDTLSDSPESAQQRETLLIEWSKHLEIVRRYGSSGSEVDIWQKQIDSFK
jgi:O-antigen ligase